MKTRYTELEGLVTCLISPKDLAGCSSQAILKIAVRNRYLTNIICKDWNINPDFGDATDKKVRDNYDEWDGYLKENVLLTAFKAEWDMLHNHALSR